MAQVRVLPVSHGLAFALANFSTGLTAPVLSLMLLARGATVSTLSAAIAVITVVTCVC